MSPLSVALAFAAALAEPAPAPAPAAGPTVVVASAADVLAEIRRPGASAVLVNLWATWCEPCRVEFPDIVRLGREYRGRGLRVVFVSTDFVADRDEARKFLAEHGVDGSSFIKEEGSDMAFIDGLDPRWTGVIPATFVYDGGGGTRWFREGKADYETLKRTIDDLLAAPAGSKPQRQD